MPQGVSVEIRDGAAFVTGPKGKHTVLIPSTVEVTVREGSLAVYGRGDKKTSAVTGTTWSLLQNAVRGVLEGFSKTLEIEGVGYRANVEGDTLVLSLGYVNPIRFKIPQGIQITAEKNVVRVSGIDKELVGRIAAEIRSLRKPEPYKGRGIHYQGEVIRRKVGKKAATASTT